jgi:PAS domain S-box-containing protein
MEVGGEKMGLSPAEIEEAVERTERQLAERGRRAPDFALESAAMQRLVDELAERPDNVLATLCELILDALDAGSAGISLLKPEAEGGDFYWPAIAGAWAHHVGGGVPRDQAPCGVVIDREAVMLFQDVGKIFPAVADASPAMSELLLAPFYRAGEPVGTVWAIAHDPARHFDSEDKRFLTSLARFAGAAWQTLHTDRVAQDATERLALALGDARMLGLWEWDMVRDAVIADEGFAELYGIDPDEAARGVSHTTFLDRVHADDRTRVAAEIANSIAQYMPFSSEYRVVGADGQIRHLLARGECSRDASGAPRRFPGMVVDITEQRRAEHALHRTEGRYRSLFNSIDVGFCLIEMIFDDDGKAVDYRFVEANPAFEQQSRLVGAVGRTMREMVPGYDVQWVELYGEVAMTGKAIRFERVSQALGSRWFDIYAYPVGEPGDRQIAILFTEITPRRQMEEALRASERQFRGLAEAMPNHVWLARPDGLLDWFNDEVYAYSGVAPGELDGEKWLSFIHPDDIAATIARWGQSLASGEPYQNEFRLLRHDGAWRWHVARAVPIRDEEGTIIRWVGTDADVEDEKAIAASLADLNAALEMRVEERTRELLSTEEALRQSQKMEAIGQLTGGIAHDFNNLLTTIIGGLELVRMRIASGRTEGLEKYMDAATVSAQRAASLTHRLLAFARRQSLDTRAQDIGALIDGMGDMLQRTLGESVALEVRADDGLWSGLTDANQFENALLNLVINARDAMPDGGTVRIEARNDLLDEAYARSHEEVEAGDYVAVSVIDTGIGMDDDVIARVFEPFFTTKPIGQGTGLGLSMIYGFTKQSGGHVRIASKPGRGTMVTLYVRRAASIEQAEQETPSRRAPRGRGEHVLLVEDDPAVRSLIIEVLDELGYRQRHAVDPQTAIPILMSSDPIDLLITDFGLPGMNGRQLAEIARAHRPDLRILFITGYAESASLRSDFLAPGMELMTKPFVIGPFAAMVRRLIDDSARGGLQG